MGEGEGVGGAQATQNSFVVLKEGQKACFYTNCRGFFLLLCWNLVFSCFLSMCKRQSHRSEPETKVGVERKRVGECVCDS